MPRRRYAAAWIRKAMVCPFYDNCTVVACIRNPKIPLLRGIEKRKCVCSDSLEESVADEIRCRSLRRPRQQTQSKHKGARRGPLGSRTPWADYRWRLGCSLSGVQPSLKTTSSRRRSVDNSHRTPRKSSSYIPHISPRSIFVDRSARMSPGSA